MGKRQACYNKERTLVSTRWSKLPRYSIMFVIFCDRILEIEPFLATRNIIGHHIRQTFHH